ncbi:adenylyl-sulfate kinase [Methylobacterium indicum]|uniref:Adenylyl-sulfate kinase n=1 Tax=Methylobacterium indicum TaxID=1775910 RepID=A0A8H8WWG7_9HYPH|nr:hypothetical protein mvi_39590 [Methylobacterium indicum]
MTGLSGAGKSTIANRVEERLWQQGRHTLLFDGDNLRFGLNKDLGFTDADRVENIRRTAEAAKLTLDAGLIVIRSLIWPFRRERILARELVGPSEILDIVVDAPIEECRRRDPKGLYARAFAGQIPNFIKISRPTRRRTRPTCTSGRPCMTSRPSWVRFSMSCRVGGSSPPAPDPQNPASRGSSGRAREDDRPGLMPGNSDGGRRFLGLGLLRAFEAELALGEEGRNRVRALEADDVAAFEHVEHPLIGIVALAGGVAADRRHAAHGDLSLHGVTLEPRLDAADRSPPGRFRLSRAGPAPTAP